MKVRAKPQKPVIGLGMSDRALANFVNIEIGNAPTSDAHKDLVGDTFFSLFKRDPKILEEVPTDRALNQAIMQWATENEDYKNTQDVCHSNLPASMVSTGVMYSMLSQDDTIKDALEKQKQAEKEQKDADELIKQALKEQGKGNTSAAEDYMKKAEAKQENADMLIQQAAQDVAEASQNPIKKHAISSAAKEAGDAGKEVQAQMLTWGIEPGEITNDDDISSIIDAAGNANFSQISKILGRLRGISRKVFAQSKAANHGAITKIGRTRDINRVLPEEIADMNVRAPRPLRIKKIGDLFTIGLIGHLPLKSKNHQGNFIAYVDRSGSMYGDPYRAAKSLVLGIGLASRDEISEDQIKYEIHGFSASLGPSVTSDDDWRAHLEWAKSTASGGTSFDVVFEDAIRRIKGCESEVQPDVLFITDGVCEVDFRTISEFAELKSERGVRLIIIQIGNWGMQDEITKYADMLKVFNDSGSFADDIENLAAEVSQLVADHYFD